MRGSDGGSELHGTLQAQELGRLIMHPTIPPSCTLPHLPLADRKSTRLNSSHSQISYAVFCLKKKKADHIRSNKKRSEIATHEEYQTFYFFSIQSSPRCDPFDTSRQDFSILDTLVPIEHSCDC